MERKHNKHNITNICYHIIWIPKYRKHLLKDDKANLVVLCDKCHDKLHNNEFEIKGLTKTTKGVKAILE